MHISTYSVYPIPIYLDIDTYTYHLNLLGTHSALEHSTSDADSTSSLPDLVDADSDESSIGIPSNDDIVIILPPSNTSSLLQPLETPTFGRWFDEQVLDGIATCI